MRALDLTPVVLAVALLGWVGVQVKRSPPRHAVAPVAERAPTPESSVARQQGAAQQPGAARAEPAEEERLQVLRRIDQSADGTFIADHLLDQDSTIVRWSEQADAVRVWVQRSSTVANWRPQNVYAAREAFGEWKLAGFPVAFVFVVDSTTAEITIRFIEKFPEDAGQQVGHTRRTYDSEHRIRNAEITIATLDSAGTAMPYEVMSAIARHEVGHALGLGHSKDPQTLMFPESRSLVISAKDRQTLRLLYMLPPGSLKGSSARR